MELETTDTKIGAKLKARRTALGLSQKELAEKIGVTFQQIQKYEKGSNALSVSRLFDFAHALNVPVTYFLNNSYVNKESSVYSLAEIGDNLPPVSDRELLELAKAFRQVTNPIIRKRFADLMRVIADVDQPDYLISKKTAE